MYSAKLGVSADRWGTKDMTQQEAIDKANQAITTQGGTLSNYRKPTAKLVNGEWLVVYDEITLQVGAFVSVAVNDITGATESSAGA